MTEWATNQRNLIIRNTLVACNDDLMYSEIWASFFEALDKNERFEIDQLFQDFIKYAISSMIFIQLGEYEPCNEINFVEQTKEEAFFLPIESLMKELSCLEEQFSENISDFQDMSDCQNYFEEYMAFISDSECFEKLVEGINREVLLNNPFKQLFQDKARMWKYSTN